jgi:beta-lactam-binding protein with PASTA domain
MSPRFRRREPHPDPAAADTEVVPPPEEYGYAEETVVEEPPPREPILWPYLLLLLLLVLGGLGALYYFTREDEAEEKPVPAVVRLTEAQAIERLDAEGFQAQSQRRRSDEAPEGIVFAQRPGAGRELEEGSTVELLISSGPASIEVPSVAGLEADLAEQRLRDAGFEVRRAEVFSEEPPGAVVAQDPGPGERAQVGSRVRINVSEGTGRVDVPDVVGRTAAEAGSILRRAGLATPRVVSVPSSEPAGTVIAQNPAAGSEVRKGEAIRINVSDGGGGSDTTETQTQAETETETETETGEASGGDGALTADDTALLPLLALGDLTRFVGQEAEATGLTVESVPGDEVFWVGPSERMRILVRLVPGSESPDIQPGDTISFSGTVLENPPGFAREVGVTAAEGGTLLVRQGVHIEVEVASLDVTS